MRERGRVKEGDGGVEERDRGEGKGGGDEGFIYHFRVFAHTCSFSLMFEVFLPIYIYFVRVLIIYP